MRIEISAGGLGAGVAVAEYQWNMSGFISDAESVIASFKAVTNKVFDLPGGVGSLQDAADSISARVQQEESKKEAALEIQQKSNDFLDLAIRVDKQVSLLVDQNKDEFYRTNPWLKPVVESDETPWYEDTWNWLCGVGDTIVESATATWDWITDTAKKAWDGLVDFYNEHWYEIINWGVTILCAVGSMVAIALIPVTGGASILLVAGVSALSSAIVAATRSITTQQRDKGTVDWSEVGKEAATAAVVGAITGAIGAGVGGAITSGLSNTGLGASLLGSSSTTVRVLTGAVIGSTSEVATGMLARGAAEAAGSYMETGTVNFGDVWDAAADPQQMAMDAAIGGVTGGIGAGKTPADSAPEPTQTTYGSVHDEGFPEESIQAVRDYTGPNHYADINQSYMDPSVKLSPQNQQIDTALTQALDQSAIPDSMTTYRGSSLKELGDLGDIAMQYKNDPIGLQQALEGKSYTKFGYMSTGDQGLAKSYAKNLHVTIDVPAGSHGLDVSISPAGKSEYLFPANSQLEIVSAEWKDGKMFINTKLRNTQSAPVQAAGTSSWQQSEMKVERFLGSDYHSQVSINSSDLSVGKHGAKGTIRVDSLRGDIGGKPQNLSAMDTLSGIHHFDAAEVKNYKIETDYGRNNLYNNIMGQAADRNQVLTQHGATVNQTYYIDTVGHPITFGQWDQLYTRLENDLPENVDIFPLWK